jgi:hypothetical protein
LKLIYYNLLFPSRLLQILPEWFNEKTGFVEGAELLTVKANFIEYWTCDGDYGKIESRSLGNPERIPDK